MTKDGSFSFLQLRNRSKVSYTASDRHFLEQGFLPAAAGASTLIKEQEDKEHLKEMTSNQITDVPTNKHKETYAEEKFACPYKLTALAESMSSGEIYIKHGAFNQDGFFSCQIFVK